MPGLDINLKDPRATVLFAKKLVAGGEIQESYPVFLGQLIPIYDLVVKLSRGDSSDMGSIPDDFEFFTSPRQLCVVLSPSVH